MQQRSGLSACNWRIRYSLQLTDHGNLCTEGDTDSTPARIDGQQILSGSLPNSTAHRSNFLDYLKYKKRSSFCVSNVQQLLIIPHQ